MYPDTSIQLLEYMCEGSISAGTGCHGTKFKQEHDENAADSDTPEKVAKWIHDRMDIGARQVIDNCLKNRIPWT
jgi:hypothetical protein